MLRLMLKLTFAKQAAEVATTDQANHARDQGAVSEVTHGTISAIRNEGGLPPFNTTWGF